MKKLCEYFFYFQIPFYNKEGFGLKSYFKLFSFTLDFMPKISGFLPIDTSFLGQMMGIFFLHLTVVYRIELELTELDQN